VDIFDIQEEISREILQVLKVELTRADETRLGRRHTANRDAYDAYLRGHYFWNQRTITGMRKATDHFRSAIDRDPTDTVAYSGLGEDC
jgi:hypothetical protein